MSEPRFEFSCSDGNESKRVFAIKNVSSITVSNMTPLSFDLFCVDNTKDNVLPFDFDFPTSLTPGQELSFEIENTKFRHRNVGDKEFKFVFSAEDDSSHKYHCVAEKNVEDSRNKEYIAGHWIVKVFKDSSVTGKSQELFKNLLSKDICAILDGDKRYGRFESRNGKQVDIGLPRLSGPMLCDISTRFGLPVEYHWGGYNLSRWSYVDDIMRHCIEQGNISSLLVFLFSKSQFSDVVKGLDLDESEEVYKQSVSAALDDINKKLQFSGSQMVFRNKQFEIIPTNAKPLSDDEALESAFSTSSTSLSSALDEYVRCESLGRGGFGEVFRYHHKQTDMDFAVKIYDPWFVTDEDRHDGEKRFFREARILYSLNNPNIVRIYDTGLLVDKPFIRMEYIQGKDLASFREEKGNLQSGDALRAIRQILKGLKCAHEAGIIHRDLKPTNVMVHKGQNKYRCIIIDFGISAFLETEGYTRLTKTGEHIAGGQYTDPNLADNPKMRDPRSDIYSVGAILYFLLYGRAPVGSDIRENLLKANRSVNQDVLNIIMKSLSTDLNKRYSSCDDFITAIEKIVGVDS